MESFGNRQENSRLSGGTQRPVLVQDDETTKRKILEEDLERSGRFLRDFMIRHRAELSDIESDATSPTDPTPRDIAQRT